MTSPILSLEPQRRQTQDMKKGLELISVRIIQGFIDISPIINHVHYPWRSLGLSSHHLI